LWSFQRKEIEAAGLKAGEDAQLENERLVLKNVARLQENADAAYTLSTIRRKGVGAHPNFTEEARKLCRIDFSLQGVVETLRLLPSVWTKRRNAFAIIWTGWRPDPDRLEVIESSWS